MSPAPSPTHQRAVRDLLIAFDAYAKKRGGEALDSPLDVVFSQIDVVEPDVVYFTADRLQIIGEKNVQGAPSLLGNLQRMRNSASQNIGSSTP